MSTDFAWAVSIRSPSDSNTLISFWVALFLPHFSVHVRAAGGRTALLLPQESIGSGVGMWTKEGINVSLGLSLELLREIAPCLGWREVLSCWVATLPSPMKNLPDSENSRVESKTERRRNTDSWLCTRIKHVWSQFYHWTVPLCIASAQPGFYHWQSKPCSRLQLCSHSDSTPISSQIFLDRAFYPLCFISRSLHCAWMLVSVCVALPCLTCSIFR